LVDIDGPFSGVRSGRFAAHGRGSAKRMAMISNPKPNDPAGRGYIDLAVIAAELRQTSRWRERAAQSRFRYPNAHLAPG